MSGSAATSVMTNHGRGAAGTSYMVAQVVLCLLAALAVLWLTPFGMRTTGDSAWYIGAARNVAEGNGFSRPTGGGEVKPLTHFPPLYPLTLTVFGFVGIDAADAARWLSAILLAANVFLVGRSVQAITNSRLGGLIGSVLCILSPTMLDVHVWILSESLYLVFLLVGFLFLGRFFRTRSDRLLVAGSAFVAMAWLTRYVGSAIVGTVLVVLLLDRSVGIRRRVRDAVLFLVIGLGPAVAWMFRNLVVAGTATNRTLAWHPMSISYFKRPFSILWQWLLPFEFTSLALYAMTALVVVGLGIWLAVRLTRGRQGALSNAAVLAEPGVGRLHCVHIAVYSIALAVSISIADASTPVDGRTTSPVYVSFLILLTVAGVLAWRLASQRKLLRPALAVLAALLLASYSYQTAELASTLRPGTKGLGSQLRQSPVLQALQDIPNNPVVYTNEPERVYLVSGVGAYMVPLKTDAVTGMANADFAQKVESMRADLLNGNAVLVLFRTMEVRPDLGSAGEMSTGLHVLFSGSDGEIFAGPGVLDE